MWSFLRSETSGRGPSRRSAFVGLFVLFCRDVWFVLFCFSFSGDDDDDDDDDDGGDGNL